MKKSTYEITCSDDGFKHLVYACIEYYSKMQHKPFEFGWDVAFGDCAMEDLFEDRGYSLHSIMACMEAIDDDEAVE